MSYSCLFPFKVGRHMPTDKCVCDACRLSLSDDPALAMAFSVARRAAAVPMLFVNGTYKKVVSNYLDSSILQHQLQRFNDHNALKGDFMFLT